ncbi:hypothetical protein MPL3356_60481 [Mesorhizobium plurifarium]|uniref:DUF3168 domain-containing protein n=1 Tax=Mesorhizobium plurifarium TaxID=69974 RepID=A0A090E9P9_MESPL|nr:hypothetical protein MPL3356_60481 [Mesorhizobium plurifarium]
MSALTIAIARLGSEAAVTDIVSSEGIYPIDLPQRAQLPCVEVNIVSGFDESMLDGAGQYYRNRVTVNCLAETALGAEQLRNAVMGALQDNKNLAIGGFVDISTSFANFERTAKADDRSVYVWTVDFFIRWKKAA